MDNILEKIYKSGLKFLVPLTPEETYALITKEAMNLVGAEYGSILLEENDELKRVYASSPIMYETKIRKRGFTYKAYKSNQPYILSVNHIARVHPAVKSLGVKSTIFIPLSYRGKSIGVLSVDSLKDEYFTKQQLDVIKLFGSMATLAIRKTELYDETKKALDLRDEFISRAAHELRTPLTTIHGYVQLLNNRSDNLSSQQSRWIKQLYFETYRMSQLVSELLDTTRIRSGKYDYELKECSFEDITKKALAYIKFVYPDRKINFLNKILLGKDNTHIIGDKDKLIQVVTQILDNACKFSSSDKEILLNLKFKDPNFILTIKDKGKGIESEDLDQVFEKFYSTDQQTDEGMGLGLFLAREVIHQHHGYIKLKSKPNRGTTVEIGLPRIKDD